MPMERRQPTTKGPAERFSGEVWIDTIAEGHGSETFSVAAVHFRPGARTAWHSHGMGQTLYVLEGEGRLQARGGPVEVIRAGDVYFAPAGEWHWHGAAPDRLMTHIAVSEGAPEWGEHVSETQ